MSTIARPNQRFAPKIEPRVCATCGGLGWVTADPIDPDDKLPCPECSVYPKDREAAPSKHPRGTRVVYITGRHGVVMRSWKRFEDCYRFCDVRFDDGGYGCCVDEDLSVEQPEPDTPVDDEGTAF